jgi:uncharacterized protein (TIGR03545 family)
MEASKKEKAIKAEIEATRQMQSQVIHFGSEDGSKLRPKFWIKKTLIKGDAKAGQDLQNFTGEILNIASDQKLIGKPIEVYFKGDLPKDNIFNINLEAKLNHHLQQINETFKVAANYPISSFKIIDDGSLKLFLKKASSRSEIDGSIIDKKIKNMSVKNSLDQADFLFESTKGDIQQILGPIFSSINSFDIDIFLKGALDNPDLTILSTLTEKISAGLKSKVASQLSEFNTELEAMLGSKTDKFKNDLLSSFDQKQSSLNSQVSGLDQKLGQQSSSVNDLMKKGSDNAINEKVEKLGNKLSDKLLKRLKK